MTQAYWLFKSEPQTYPFSQLIQDRKTNWNGVRNYQARNFLRSVAEGDLVLIYHSGEEKAVVGIAKVTRSGYPDPDSQKPGDWVQVDLVPVEGFRRPVPLAEIKSRDELKDLLLIKQSRLSVMPIPAKAFQTLLNLGRQSK